jgi:hypothetical protein
MTTKPIAAVGTISHGTMKTQDLLRAFASELERLTGGGDPIDPVMGSGLVSDAREWAKRLDGDPSLDDVDCADDILNDVANALDAFAPEGCYFGPHYGDESDWGFWPRDEEPS